MTASTVKTTRARVGLLLAAMALGGCLPEEGRVTDDNPAARQILPADKLEFVNTGSFQLDENKKLWVLAKQRKQEATRERGGVHDLWAVSYETAEKRLLIRNHSDSWSIQRDGQGHLLVMREERLGTWNGNPVRVGILSRVTLQGQVLEDIPDVTGFAVTGPRRFYYRRPVGKLAQDLVVRDSQGRERVLSDVTGDVIPFGTDGYYVISGAERMFSRMRNTDAPLEPLRAGVARLRFFDGPNGRTVIMTVPFEGRASTVVFDIPTRSERELPGKNICCWLQQYDSTFVYAEGAAGNTPAKLHYEDLATAVHREVVLPTGLRDVTYIIERPPSYEKALYVDSSGNVALADPAANPPIRLLADFKPLSPRFTGDGKYLLYVDPTAVAPEPEGHLMIRDADFLQPPRRLTPVGSVVTANSFFADATPAGKPYIVFWARYGRSAADLYFADPDTGAATLIAKRIRDVSVTSSRLFGILNTSMQDLVGDFVRQDLETGMTSLIAQQVDSFATYCLNLDGDNRCEEIRTVFYVRNRYSSSQDGLWAYTLP